ncbi:MAG: hypothetical protein OEZ58_14160 [Gammaproteobacteria bacterium]|nr:hypothetical protein [Gammaproteobacteria bacterium]
MIEKMHMTNYEDDGWTNSTLEFLNPNWDVVLDRLKSMHNYSRPDLWLLKYKDIPDSYLLAVNGGSGIYHIQVNDGVYYHEAIDPSGSNEEVDIWLSDQGFSTEKRKTWNLEKAIEMVEYYFNFGEMNPNYEWSNE